MAAGSVPFLLADLLTRSAFNSISPKFASDLKNAFTWACVTVYLISAPLLGKVVQAGAERVLGTIIGACTPVHAADPAMPGTLHPPLRAAGGCLGWAMAATSEYACAVVGLFVVTLAGMAFGVLFRIEYAGKLFIITYLIGEHHWEERQPPSPPAFPQGPGPPSLTLPSSHQLTQPLLL